MLKSNKIYSLVFVLQKKNKKQNKTSFTLPRFIEVSVPRQESERTCNCVLRVSILPLFKILNCSNSVAFLVFHFL